MYTKAAGLFLVAAVAEVLGCYVPYLRLKKSASPWLLFWTTISLIVFFCLLVLHPAVASRIYVAYSGFYVAVALFWVSEIDEMSVSVSDVLSVIVIRVGMAAIALAG